MLALAFAFFREQLSIRALHVVFFLLFFSVSGLSPTSRTSVHLHLHQYRDMLDVWHGRRSFGTECSHLSAFCGVAVGE